MGSTAVCILQNKRLMNLKASQQKLFKWKHREKTAENKMNRAQWPVGHIFHIFIEVPIDRR